MKIFHNRPFAFAACLLALCAVGAQRLEGWGKLLLAVVCLLLFSALLSVGLFRKRFGRRTVLSLLCLGAVAAALISSFSYFNVRYEKYQAYNDTECRVEGVVLERLGSAAYYTQLRVRVISLEGESCNVNARLMCNYPSALQAGDRFMMTAVPTDPAETELVREETSFLAEGNLMYLTCSSADLCEILPEEDHSLAVAASKLNTRLSYALRNQIGGEEGGVAVALLLGNRSWISDDTTLHFRRAGISHLLALSGLHVSILIGFFEFFLRKLHLPKTARACIIPAAALGYLALTGFAVSTWRAVLMLCVLYVGFLWSAEYDSFTALCGILALILLFTPYAVHDPSLWMSFLAAASIIVFSPAVSRMLDIWQSRRKLPPRLFKILKSVVTAVAVGVVANLALLLYVAYLYGEISLASVPATLALSLPVTWLLILSTILLCLPFLPFLPEVCAALGGLILRVAAWFSNIENILLPAEDLLTMLCLTALTAVLIFLAVANLKSRRWALPIPALFLLTLCTSFCVTHFAGTRLPVTLEAGVGELRLYSQKGVNVLINDTRGNASEAYEIKLAASADYCTEVRDLVFCRYYNQATYFISRLSAQVKVCYLHLPQPANDRERFIAARLEQEAALHGIEVLYDAEEMLLVYD